MSSASFPEVNAGVIHVINSITGSAMKIPTANLKPGGGYLDAKAGYFGIAPPAMDFAALSVTSSPDSGQAVSIFCNGLPPINCFEDPYPHFIIKFKASISPDKARSIKLLLTGIE